MSGTSLDAAAHARAVASTAPGRARGARWLGLGSLPFLAATLVAVNGLYILFVAFGNMTDFGTNQAFVQHVLSMDTTNFGAKQGTHLDPDVMWRAITTPWIQNAAYVLLIAWETLTAVVLIAAVVYWVHERAGSFRVARALSSRCGSRRPGMARTQRCATLPSRS